MSKLGTIGVVWGVAWLLLSANTEVGGALVQTRDGRNFLGEVRFVPLSTLVVVSDHSDAVSVALTNLWRLSFEAEAYSLSMASATNGSTNVAVNAAGLPVPWQDTDIGEMEMPGQAQWQDGTFRLECSRGHGSANREAFHFVYQAFRGDWEIVARVAEFKGLLDRDRRRRPVAGVVIRTSLDSDSLSVLMGIRQGGGSTFYRWEKRKGLRLEQGLAGLAAPFWVKLRRQGNTLTGYRSRDGQYWEYVQREDPRIPERIYVGLGLFNRDANARAQAALDCVAVRRLQENTPFVPQIVLRNGTVIADPLVSVDDDEVHFSERRQKLRVRTRDVARLILEPPSPADQFPTNRFGVLLRFGEFLEGEFRSLASGAVKVNSVLYGYRSLRAEDGLVAVLLRDPVPAPAAFRVITADGSDLRATSVQWEDGTVSVSVPMAGQLHIPQNELLEIRAGARASAAR